jgi:hypothetical protein
VKHLQALLDDVLAGRTLVCEPATFSFLRQLAPDKLDLLNDLASQAIARRESEATKKMEAKPEAAIAASIARLEICCSP